MLRSVGSRQRHSIQGMLSKKEVGADSLKEFKQFVDLGDHLFIKGPCYRFRRPASCLFRQRMADC